MASNQEQIINSIREWAVRNKDIDFILITGSNGNDGRLPDAYSDIDVIVFCKRSPYYRTNSEWLSEIAEPVSYFHWPATRNLSKIYFANGVCLDIGFISTHHLAWGKRYAFIRKYKPLYRLIPRIVRGKVEALFNEFSYQIHRGYYPLIDKGDHESKMKYAREVFAYKKAKSFEIERLHQSVNQFWQYALQMAVKLQRKEFFTAKFECDHIMKKELLYIIEMYTKSIQGEAFETWHKGRYIEQWAAPFITAQLPGVYGRYEEEDAWKSLMAMIELFSELSHSLITQYPEAGCQNPERYFREWIADVRKNAV
ncbi:aminoglycoside 6-adenylyltransferase [Chitinophaga pendula]|uniref:aminoglycoside 6-adenylyltransferase n=1 Tax=Chitinophaga TaxID=79328 RepID=UPI000BB01E04|nr:MULTISPECIES: aminoglycoside 6-adenylyltransferase [Chitinophaga]ASZ12171.1 hypothetical protein CK934_14975 [Chitinophaga sp. MD30]UCJ04801.1 aminoglycoside 6-adenylyltransferase [Chitinophaga pendula]